MALSTDGQIRYTILSGSQSVARFNMLTQQADYTYAVPSNANTYGGITLRGVAAQSGTEDTIALDLGAYSGNVIYDFNPAMKTARYVVSKLARIPVPASNSWMLPTCRHLIRTIPVLLSTTAASVLVVLPTTTHSILTINIEQLRLFKLSGGLAFANAGGIANSATMPATQIGVFANLPGGEFSTLQNVAPDTSLQRAYFLSNTGLVANSSTVDGVVAYNQSTFLPSGAISLNMAATEGGTAFTGLDLIRWGQDGLAALTSGGHIYLLRGPAVVPQLLQTNTAAVLTTSSSSTLTVGSGNTLLTLTGTNFVPGVAATWNGGYRTTTIVDATHLSVAIPASDLAASRTATIVATIRERLVHRRSRSRSSSSH